jgi:hypothetical protein
LRARASDWPGADRSGGLPAEFKRYRQAPGALLGEVKTC